MSEGSQFSFPRFKRTEKLKPIELDIYIELCPAPVMLIDNRTHRIVKSNPAAQKFIGYTKDELENLFIQDILDNPTSILISDLVTDPNPQAFGPCGWISKDHSLRQAPAQAWQVSGLKGPTLLILDPGGSSSNRANNSASADPWEPLDALLSIIADRQPKDALNQLLKSAQGFSDIASLAVYLASHKDLELVRQAQAGDANWLPERLPMQDFVNLPKPRRWTYGKRPLSGIARAAHDNKIAHTISFPLNPENKTIGILVLTDLNQEPSAYLGKALVKLVSLAIQTSHYTAEIENQGVLLSNLQNLDAVLKDATQEGIIVLSPDFKVIELNSAAEGILGYHRRQTHHQPVEKVLIGTETLQQALNEIQQTHGLANPVDVRIYRRSGEAFLARLSARPVYTGDNLMNIILFLQDRSLEESALEQTRQLEQRAILGEIMAVFAHEVRNPINNISTGLELISLNLPQEDANQATISRLLQDCDRLAELMKSVLAYSKPSEYSLNHMSLEPFLQNLLERNRPRLERSRVYGSLNVEQDLPPIMGNPRALEQVFTNLINNALQAFGDSGGQIVIRANRPQVDLENSVMDRKTAAQQIDVERFVEISIVDTGPGIPQEQLEKIFKPFYTTNFSGTGLGLAISKRIITAHRGFIDVTSFPGGTVFKVYLPAHEAPHNDGSQTSDK